MSVIGVSFLIAIQVIHSLQFIAMEAIIVKNENILIERLWTQIEQAADEAIAANSVFRVGLSGGSLVKYLANGAKTAKTDWAKWELYMCDERFVDDTNDDSNFGQYKKLFIPQTGLNESQFVVINRSVNLDDCATDYEQQIRTKFAIEKPAVPVFDLLLLGMGPDGHTCSLFPGHPLLDETTRLIAPISNSPKPPPERVTMTYPLINNAKLCLFPICGDGKAEMIRRIHKDKEVLPAGMVKTTHGKVIWLLDEGAAKDAAQELSAK